MRTELTKQECRWLADLADKARADADSAYKETLNPIFELRRDNMADLKNKMDTAIQKQNRKERSSAR